MNNSMFEDDMPSGADPLLLFNVTSLLASTSSQRNSSDDGQPTTSTAILAVVAVVAIVTLFVFATATFRYWFAHKGEYHLGEGADELTQREVEDALMNNIYKTKTTQEWFI